MYLVVGCLRKVFIPDANGYEWLGSSGADYQVNFRGKLVAGLSGGNRNGHDNPGGFSRPYGPACRKHAGACRQSVVYKYNGAVTDFGRWTIAAVQTFAPL
jgi:hypothetical protein